MQRESLPAKNREKSVGKGWMREKEVGGCPKSGGNASFLIHISTRALGWDLAHPILDLGPWLGLVAHIPPLSSPRSRNFGLICKFQGHFLPILSPVKSCGLVVRFSRHFSEIF